MAGGISFGEFALRVQRLEDQLEGAALKKAMTRIGVDAKKIAAAEASRDLGGDPAFSGWKPRGDPNAAPYPLNTRFDHVGDGKILFTPTPRSAGPWTVAEFGRNQAAGPRMVGPRLTKTGKVSKARQKRYNGRTQGKGTATRTTDRIDSMVGKASRELVDKALRGFWR
jgi:hypothetical protein